MKTSTPTRLHYLAAIVLFCLLSACGGAASPGGANSSSADSAANGDSGGSGAAPAIPTMPAARFAQPTTQIGAAITETGSLTATNAPTATVESAAPAADTSDLARGEQAYGRLCAECHGEEGEGVAGQGNALVDFSLERADFINLLRTGGGLGPDHLFGPQRISPESANALYAYLQSLASSTP